MKPCLFCDKKHVPDTNLEHSLFFSRAGPRGPAVLPPPRRVLRQPLLSAGGEQAHAAAVQLPDILRMKERRRRGRYGTVVSYGRKEGSELVAKGF